MESKVTQVTPVPGKTSLKATDWPQHVAHSVLYRKGVRLFGVKGVPPGNDGASKKWLGIFITYGVGARLGWTASYLTEPNLITFFFFGSRGKVNHAATWNTFVWFAYCCDAWAVSVYCSHYPLERYTTGLWNWNKTESYQQKLTYNTLQRWRRQWTFV